MEIRSYSQLKKVLEKAARNSMKDLGKKGVEVAKQKVDSEVYDVYDPVDYSRSYDLRESLDSREVGSGDVVEVEVYHDTSKIYPDSPNRHMSIVDGSSSVEYIANIVHDGLAPNIFNDRTGYPWMKKRPYMDETKKEIQSKNIHTKTIKESLKRQGFKVE